MDLVLAAAAYLGRTSGSHVTSHTGDLVFIDAGLGYWAGVVSVGLAHGMG
jgi:hypothetical protein